MAGRIAYYGNIVQDGLVLNLDAARKDSYDRQGTTWNDISGNGNNGTLTNGPTFDSEDYGSIVFDGVDDKVLYGPSSGTNYSNIHTFTCWLKISNKTGPGPIIIGHNAFNQGGYALWFDYSSNAIYYSPSDGNFKSISYTLPTNTWIFASVVRNITSLVWYINGVQIGTGTTSTADLLCSSIGSYRSSTTYVLNGKISTVRVYDQALTQTEISQNFNALRGRYGI